MPCSANPYRDEAMKQYFDALPPFVQENIMQCNPKIQTMDELRTCAEKLMKPQ